MNQVENLPPVKWALVHPRIAAWIVLSLGMVILLVIEASDVGLQAGQWIALIVATVLVAGLCIWIVSWEDVDDSAPADPLDTGEIAQVVVDDTAESTPAS